MGSNRDWGVDQQFLIAPPFAGPDDPSVVIGLTGADLPPELVAYYLAEPSGAATLIMVSLYKKDSNEYTYDGLILIGTFPLRVFGGYDGVAVKETYRINNFGDMSYGFRSAIGTPSLMQMYGTLLAIREGDPSVPYDRGWLTINQGTSFSGTVDGRFTIDGRDQARGLKAWIASAANTAAVAAEAIVLTSPAFTIRTGRAYMVSYAGRLASSIAQIASTRVRLTNLAGASLIFAQYQRLGVESSHEDHTSYFRRTAAGDLTFSVVVLTYQASAGTVTGIGAADGLRYLKVEDCGLAADFPTAIAV